MTPVIRRSLPALVVVGLFALHLVLSRSMDGFILADGTGYLANARWLAGRAAGTWQGPAAFYNAGWSLVVAPIYLFTRSPATVHTAVLLLNAALASLSFLAYRQLGRQAFDLDRRTATLAGLVAAAYPAVLLQASFEWSESLFHLAFPLLLLGVHRFLRAPSPFTGAAVGALASALNLIHPKGLGAVGAIGIGLVVLAWRDPSTRQAAAAGIAALLVVFVATRVLHGALQDALYDKSASGIEGDVLGRITDPRLVWGAFQRLWGQLWYLTVASLGLLPLGVITLVRRRDVRFAAITLGTCGAILAASCLQMSDGTRIDHMVYGRYDEGFLPALLVAGVAGLWLHRTRALRLAAVGGGVSIALAALALVLNGPDRFTGGPVMPLNVVGVLVYRGRLDEVDVVVVTLLALVPIAIIGLLTRRSVVVGLATIVVLFAGSSLSVEARTIRPWEDYWSSITAIPDVVHDIGYRGPIGYDLAAYAVDAADLYQLELTDVGDLLFFDSRTSEHLPGSDLIIASPQWDRPGARIAFVETGPYPQALWVLPGGLQDRLDADGALLPVEHSARLDVETQRATLTVHRADDHLDVHVSDDGGTWLPIGPIAGVVQGTVRLGARWYADGDVVATDTAELPRVLRRGDEVDLDLPIADLAPGTYDVIVSLRQEGIAWWDASEVRLRVTITADR